jgi:predicted dehydrogenase
MEIIQQRKDMTKRLICIQYLLASVLLPVLATARSPVGSDAKPLQLVVAGLVHGHVDGFFRSLKNRHDVQIVGIFEPDESLQKRYGQRYGFTASVFFTNLNSMLDKTKPEAVVAFTDTYDHLVVVQAAAKRHIPVMMEKPLAVSVEQARGIQQAADQGGIQVIVNYETTWYRSHASIWQIVKQQHAMGDIRKMVAMDGHPGPKEIGVGPEFLGWLTDPAKNGAGALFDFGCYGANLMTWLMDNQRPSKVTALTQTIKPNIYAKVDDQATILVDYPQAQGIIQASWNWPYSRKDFEVYGEHGYAVATGGDILHVRLGKEEKEEAREPVSLAPDETDSVSCLKAVVRGKLRPSGLSSLENNVIVVEILAAARESARSGHAVTLR